MYFTNFPKIVYSVDNGASYQLVTDITKRIILDVAILNNVTAFSDYVIADGESPEFIADKFYNNTQYDYVILVSNNIIDPIMDWPLSQYELENYCKDKYTNIYGIHHYEDTNGITVNSDFPGAVSVSNYEYEDRINESKRSIKILNPRLIPDFVNQFNKLING